MKRSLLLIAIFCASSMAMGFASREWRPHPVQQGGNQAYDMHLKYYEVFRPALLAGAAAASALCNGEGAETAGAPE